MLNDKAVYVTAFLLSLVILVSILQLQRSDTDLRIPFSYSGDAMFYHIITKGMTDHGWFTSNPSMGAPGEMNLHDVPTSDHNFYLLLLKILSLFTSNYAQIVNLFYLFSFPLTTLSALYVLHHFGISWLPSLFAALLFTFAPFHFVRGEHHLFLSSYYLIPLMVMAVLWVLSGKLTLWKPENGRQKLHWRNWQLIVSLLICALIASTGTYYAFFACFFLLLAGIIATVQRCSLRPLLAPLALIAVISTVTVLHLLPSMFYLQRNGDTPIVRRNVSDSEAYGLRIAQLLMPITHHRVYRISEFKGFFNQRAFINENDDASLGLIGSCGFLVLIGFVFFRRPNKLETHAAFISPLLPQLGQLNLAGVLLATMGGFGALFAFFISPKIRAWNRLSIWIAFFAFFAIALLLEYVSRCWINSRQKQIAFGIFLTVVLAAGLFDQTSKRYIPPFKANKAELQSDADFVQRIESLLPANSTVFQLPVMVFPENPKIHKMLDYDLAKGFLNSRQLRWSYGAIKNREADVWQKMIAAKPVTEMIQALCLTGFQGLWIDRFGYADNGARLETEIASLLSAVPQVSNNSRLSFFDLRAYSQKLREKYPPQEYETLADETRHPLMVLWQDGFYDEERNTENYWRWSAERGRMEIVNNSRRAKQIRLDMMLAAGRDAHLQIESALFSERLPITFAGVHLSRTLIIAPGRHLIRFACDAPRVISPLDPRILVFRLQNFKITELSASPAVAVEAAK